MKIIIVGRSIPLKSTGMIGIFEYEQAKLLSQHGIESSYFFTDNRSIKVHTKIGEYIDTINGIPCYGTYLPTGGLCASLYDFLKFLQFRKLLNYYIEENGKPDIIHFHFPLITCNKRICEYLKKLDIRIVVTEHWTKVMNYNINMRKKTFMKYLYNNSTRYFVVSELLKESVDNILDLKENQSGIEVIPNFVEDKYFYFGNDFKQNNPDEIKFFFSGRLTPIKNVQLLVRSFHLFLKEYPEAYLNIYGDGPEKNRMVDLTQKLGITNKIKFHGFISREKMPERIEENDVFISASKLETFGVPIIEAMAKGKLVISTKNGPLDSMIIDNGGSLFEGNDYQDLTYQMLKIAKNINTFDRDTIIKNTYSIYSGTKVANLLIKNYEEVIKSHNTQKS